MLDIAVKDFQFEKFPLIATHSHAREWLKWQWNRGLAPNTLEAYGRGLEGYLRFLGGLDIKAERATRLDVAAYIRELLSPKDPAVSSIAPDSRTPIANATLQQRATILRLFYDYLVEEGVRDRNPVRQNQIGAGGYGTSLRLIPRYSKLPWIPSNEEWHAVLRAASQERLRNRLMLAMSYDSALRREELCSLEAGDIDPAHRLIRIRAEKTKGRRERVVPFSETTGELYLRYLVERRQVSRNRDRLFVSESRRNRGRPLSIWTWSKVVKKLAQKSGVARFTTHTSRHLCLTDLARSNWDIREIAEFAGHRSVQTTILYIHLSGRDLAEKIARGMAQMHTRRIQLMAEVLR
jgi:integrase/recombinase XerD